MRPLGSLVLALAIVVSSVLPSPGEVKPLRDEDLELTTAAGRVEPDQLAPSPTSGPQDPRARFVDGRTRPDAPATPIPPPIPPQNLLPLGPLPLLEQLNVIRQNR